MNFCRASGGPLAEDPGGHAAVVLDDGGLEGIDEDSVEFVGEVKEHVFIDKEPLLAVGHLEEIALKAWKVHADAGGEAAEKKTAAPQDSPEFGEHGAELVFVAGEMEDGGADDGIHAGIGKRHLFDEGDLKIFRR